MRTIVLGKALEWVPAATSTVAQGTYAGTLRADSIEVDGESVAVLDGRERPELRITLRSFPALQAALVASPAILTDGGVVMLPDAAQGRPVKSGVSGDALATLLGIVKPDEGEDASQDEAQAESGTEAAPEPEAAPVADPEPTEGKGKATK